MWIGFGYLYRNEMVKQKYYPRRLPMWTASGVQHIMVDVEPPDVVVALGR